MIEKMKNVIWGVGAGGGVMKSAKKVSLIILKVPIQPRNQQMIIIVNLKTVNYI